MAERILVAVRAVGGSIPGDHLREVLGSAATDKVFNAATDILVERRLVTVAAEKKRRIAPQGIEFTTEAIVYRLAAKRRT
jgi:hypothetical protein